MTTAVRFRGVSRHFGEVKAVDEVNLDVASGEFFAMLGPSGSGKTTCLRLIAGFEQPTTGEIDIFGEASSRIPPYRRPVNTVFQDYALFPHLRVAANVGFGLDRADAAQRAHRIEEMLARTAGRIDHVRLDRLSPLAAPLMLEMGKISLTGGSAEEELLAAESSLLSDLMPELR